MYSCDQYVCTYMCSHTTSLLCCTYTSACTTCMLRTNICNRPHGKSLPTHPHCPILCHSQEVSSLRGEHTGRVCAAPVCVEGAWLTGGGGVTAEKRERVCKHKHTHTHITWPTYVLLPTRTSWAERWPQFVQGSKWEVEEKLK